MEEENTFSIPTTYKGTKMRSRLEANFAYFLDKLKVKWQYEPKSFLLSSGKHYMPDFYLPELKVWVECKGKIIKQHKEYWKEFVDLTQKEFMVVSCGGNEKNTYATYYEPHQESKGGWDYFEPLIIGCCKGCGSYFFCGMYGGYECRKCGVHNGDHDIRTVGEDLDFQNIESVKQTLKYLG